MHTLCCCSTFDIMWREAMMELLDQLEAENPEDQALAPKACAMLVFVCMLHAVQWGKLCMQSYLLHCMHPQRTHKHTSLVRSTLLGNCWGFCMRAGSC